MKINIGISYKLADKRTTTVKAITKKGRGYTVEFTVRGNGKAVEKMPLAGFEKAAGL